MAQSRLIVSYLIYTKISLKQKVKHNSTVENIRTYCKSPRCSTNSASMMKQLAEVWNK